MGVFKMRKIFDTSRELVLSRYKEGLRLCRPVSDSIYPETRKLNYLFHMPFSIYFLTTESEVCNMNEAGLDINGLDSLRVIKGKTVIDVFGYIPGNEAVIENDKKVLSRKNMQIFAEEIIYSTKKPIKFLSFKYPCYGEDYQLNGVFGFSMIVGNAVHLAKSMEMVLMTGLFNSVSSLKTSKFSKREQEILVYMRKGKTALGIANELNLSKRTVEAYIENIRNKTGMESKNNVLEMLETYYF